MSHEPKPLNRREMTALEMIYGLHAKADEMDKLEGRMREVGVWQYYRAAYGLLEKVLLAVIDSLPDRNKRHMEAIRTQYLVSIQPKPIIGSYASDHIISTKDLQMVCESAMRDRCSVCIKSLKEARKCPLRELYLEFAPPKETENFDMCEYAVMKQPKFDEI